MRILPSLFCLLLLLTIHPLLAEEPAPQRIAFGSCLDQKKPQPIWKAVVAQRPDLFVFLGDNVYADTPDQRELAQAYERQAKHPDFSLLTKVCSFVGTWDDHDYGVNDSGREWPHKQASKEEMMKFFRLPMDSPMRGREGVYQAYEMGPPGKRVQIILLDTRWFRSSVYRLPRAQAKALNRATGKGPYRPSLEPDAKLLGEAQWQWLSGVLREPAQLRLICSSIPVTQEGTGWETWDNFPAERQRLYDLISETKAEGVVILSGDSHRAEFSRVEGKTPYPLWELNASGLTENARSRPPNGTRVGEIFIGDNFGLVNLDWQSPEPNLTLEVRDVDNQVVMQKNLIMSELRSERNMSDTSSSGKYHALRLRPGQDLKKSLLEFIADRNIQACAVVSCVGSLTKANLRFAERSQGVNVEGPLEILSLSGTGGQGKWHLHLSVADKDGTMRGGHLLDGSVVRTTAEIVLLELPGLRFERRMDKKTGYPELSVEKD